MWSLLHRPLTGFGVLAAQVLKAANRDDLPSLLDQDPSGWFGDSSLPTLRICVLGDSTVTAPGVVPPSAAWAQRMGRRLGDRFSVELQSVAVGGSKVRDVLTKQVAPAIELDPDVMVISVGANDALRGTPLVRFEAEYELLLDRLLEHTPLVVAGGVGDLGTLVRLPTFARAIARVRGRAVNNAIRRAARARPGVVKTQTWGGQWHAFERYPESTFGPDLFHASAEGHRLFAAAAYAGVDAVLDSEAGRRLIASRESPGSVT
jgi:lysophospholipase L1-like esterase